MMKLNLNNERYSKNIKNIKTLASYLEKIQINNTNMKVEFIEKIKKEEEREKLMVSII